MVYYLTPFDFLLTQYNKIRVYQTHLCLILICFLNSLVLFLKVLETVDTPDLMIEITKTLTQVSNLFPDATLAIFQDVVDILIAWHIDPSQDNSVIEFISSILVELRPYWLKDMNFTIILLYQFLEDMESYLNETNRRKELEKIEKISALLKVFNTVIKSISCIGDTSYQPLKVILTADHEKQLIAALKKIIGYIVKISDAKLNELIYGPGLFIFNQEI